MRTKVLGWSLGLLIVATLCSLIIVQVISDQREKEAFENQHHLRYWGY